MVTPLLYVFSVLLACSLVHQLSGSRGGSPAHVIVGFHAMGYGAVIAVLVAIRGAAQESLSPAYLAHLAVGFPFFAALFLTGWLGCKATRNARYARAHRICARLTAGLLAATLALGILSRMLSAG